MSTGKKEPTGKFVYKSILTGEYVMPHQWIAEVLVDRKAKYKKTSLPYKFWTEPKSEWSKEFKRQVQKVAKLLQVYSEEAILNFMKNNSYKFSVLTQYNQELIKREQDKINSRKTETNIEISDAFDYVHRTSGKKTLLGSLNKSRQSS